MDNRPTHANIDGAKHLVTTIEDAGPNSAHTHRIRFACGLSFDLRGEHQLQQDRWIKLHDIPLCGDCHDVEIGKITPVVTPQVKRNIRLPDVSTGIPCPECGSEVRIRRHDSTTACTNGHDIDFPAVQASALRLMTRLAKGEFTHSLLKKES